jgi:glycerol-3-phosphate dehydrogenase (NAD(P)+)
VSPSPPRPLALSPLSFAVLGAGSWGTALAWLLGRGRRTVHLWCRDPERAIAIQRERVNARYLPGVILPPSVLVDASLVSAAEEAALVVVAVPVAALRAVLAALAPCLGPGTALLIAAKGLEEATGLRVSEVTAAVLGPAWAERVAVLSGPNLAAELVRELPTTSVVAGRDREVTARCQEWLATPFFRVYTNADLTGVELGGALKNVIAIAAGISDGLGFGDNTKAAILTRGLAEMARLATACGARPETLMGLSGLGDLVATCASGLSRNHRLGQAIGAGQDLPAALAALGQVAEGVATAAAARGLARERAVEVPITDAVYAVLHESADPRAAVASLMSRRFRDE